MATVDSNGDIRDGRDRKVCGTFSKHRNGSFLFNCAYCGGDFNEFDKCADHINSVHLRESVRQKIELGGVAISNDTQRNVAAINVCNSHRSPELECISTSNPITPIELPESSIQTPVASTSVVNTTIDESIISIDDVEPTRVKWRCITPFQMSDEELEKLPCYKMCVMSNPSEFKMGWEQVIRSKKNNLATTNVPQKATLMEKESTVAPHISLNTQHVSISEMVKARRSVWKPQNVTNNREMASTSKETERNVSISSSRGKRDTKEKSKAIEPSKTITLTPVNRILRSRSPPKKFHTQIEQEERNSKAATNRKCIGKSEVDTSTVGEIMHRRGINNRKKD